MDNDLPNNLKRPSNKSSQNITAKIFLGIIALIIIAGLSFWGGMHYQKSHNAIATTAATAGSGFRGGAGGGGFAGRGGFGEVTAISSTSISVQNPRSGTTTVYAITSSTVITDNGATVTYSDIQDGDTVIVIASSSSSTTASKINVNPSYGGGSSSPAVGSQTTQGT